MPGFWRAGPATRKLCQSCLLQEGKFLTTSLTHAQLKDPLNADALGPCIFVTCVFVSDRRIDPRHPIGAALDILQASAPWPVRPSTSAFAKRRHPLRLDHLQQDFLRTPTAAMRLIFLAHVTLDCFDLFHCRPLGHAADRLIYRAHLPPTLLCHIFKTALATSSIGSLLLGQSRQCQLLESESDTFQ